jgi:hypothetical protein
MPRLTFFSGCRAFTGSFAVAGGWPSGLAVAPKVASAPRGPGPAKPASLPGSIPAAGGTIKNMGNRAERHEIKARGNLPQPFRYG